MPSSVVPTLLSFCLGAATATAAFLAARLRKRRQCGAHYVQTPHAGWQPGEPQPPPYDSDAIIDLDPAKVDTSHLYPFLISAVVPRPIAFISSVSNDGSRNLSPYSYFNTMGHNPPTVCIGICRSPTRGGGKKDSLINIEETG